MNLENQRIEIAKACGWKWESNGSGGQLLRRPDGTIENGHYAESWRVPDYLNDLNAMHDAEEKLRSISCEQPTDELWRTYRQCLEYVAGPLEMAHATAPVRAKAFIRTLRIMGLIDKDE